MAHGKMKTLHGLYKKIGREAFLEAAKCYSNHVCDTVDATLSEMESTEAEKMVNDYNNGIAIFDSIELPNEQTLII